MAAKIPDGYKSWREYYKSLGLEDYYDKYLAEFDDDEGLKGLKADWYNFSFETVPNAVNNVTEGAISAVKWLMFAGIALGAYILYKKVK